MQHAISWEAADRALGGRAPFLASLTDGPDNELRIVLEPACLGEVEETPSDSNPGVQALLSGCRPVEPDEQRQITILFDRYLLYQVRSESFARFDSNEAWEGTYLRVYESSRLLDQLSAMTHAGRFPDGSCYPGPWKHYGIYTQDHVIDVLAFTPPAITSLN